MNPALLLELFAQSLAAPHLIHPSRAPSILKIKRKFCTSEDEFHLMYELSQLSVLLNSVKSNAEDLTSASSPDGLSIRYLVNRHGDCLLAKEGRPSYRIPGHGQMSSTCYAAGNLFFDSETHELKAINHQSGDFQPPMQSLVFILKILLNSSYIHLSADFYLVLNQFTQSSTEERFVLTEELKNAIAEMEGQEDATHAHLGYVSA